MKMKQEVVKSSVSLIHYRETHVDVMLIMVLTRCVDAKNIVIGC